MNTSVDVLNEMERASSRLFDAGLHGDLSLDVARDAVAELIEVAEEYADAEAALANREIEGINAQSIDRLQSRVYAARRDLESALARVKGA